MIIEKKIIEVHGFSAELTCYLWSPSSEYANGECRPCILILPGGGYSMVADREGDPIAFHYLSEGYQTAVLRYSVAPAVYPTALLQAAKAVSYLRENHVQYHIDPEKIMVQGFSAGGHLAASLGVFWKEPFMEEALKIKAELMRPDGEILCYPVITSGEYAHRDSFVNLLGNSYAALVDKMSLEKQDLSGMPRTFIWHTYEDDLVPVENSLLFVQALRRYGVNTEFHMYSKGVHGLSLANEVTRAREGYGVQKECQTWMPLVKIWLSNF